MSSAPILPLVCPGCGKELRGLEQDVVFGCGDCRRHFEVVGNGWVERPVEMAARADDSNGKALFLPLWAFRVRTTATWPDPGREAEASLLPRIERVYVTAFCLHGASYFGDPGLIFTEKRVELQAGAWAPLHGCVRSLDSAKQFVEPHILSLIDRRVDVTGVTLSCMIDDARLWGIPYVDNGDAVEDHILGLRLPSAALDDVAAIRASENRG